MKLLDILENRFTNENALNEMPDWMDKYPDWAKDNFPQRDIDDTMTPIGKIDELIIYSKEGFYGTDLVVVDKYFDPVGWGELAPSEAGAYQFRNIRFDNDHRGRGLGTKLYITMLDLGYKLAAASTLNPDSMKLWVRLWEYPSINVVGFSGGKTYPLALDKKRRLTPIDKNGKMSFRDVHYHATKQ